MQFTLTKEKSFILNVLNTPSIYTMTKDDLTGELYDVDVNTTLFVKVEDEGRVLGMFMLSPLNSVCFEIHTCLFPHIAPSTMFKIVEEGYKWLFEATCIKKLITYVPSFNKKALRFAKFSGMKEEGIITKSFLREGVLVDQILLGIEKEIVCQQHQ